MTTIMETQPLAKEKKGIFFFTALSSFLFFFFFLFIVKFFFLTDLLAFETLLNSLEYQVENTSISYEVFFERKSFLKKIIFFFLQQCFEKLIESIENHFGIKYVSYGTLISDRSEDQSSSVECSTIDPRRNLFNFVVSS
jgi:hypothetical protein